MHSPPYINYAFISGTTTTKHHHHIPITKHSDMQIDFTYFSHFKFSECEQFQHPVNYHYEQPRLWRRRITINETTLKGTANTLLFRCDWVLDVLVWDSSFKKTSQETSCNNLLNAHQRSLVRKRYNSKVNPKENLSFKKSMNFFLSDHPPSRYQNSPC